mgnify:CR=1 FL=1
MTLQVYTLALGNFRDDTSGNNYAANTPVYILNSGGTLADIFRDQAGAQPIAQDGLNNISDAYGEFTFYVNSGQYISRVAGRDRLINVVGSDYFDSRVDDAVEQITQQTLASRGFRVVGAFADGFTYELFNDVGIDANGNSWIYVGDGAPNKVVSAGTVPSVGSGYEQVAFNSASEVTSNGGKSLQYHVDDMQGFTSALFAEAGITPNGDPDTALTSQRLDALKLLNIGNLNIAYEASTVGSLLSDALVFPDGKIINILDRGTSFIFNIGGTPNGFDVLNAGNGNTVTLIDKTRVEHFGANGDGVFDNGPLITYLKSSGFKVHFTPGLIYRTTTSFQLSNETEFHGNWSTLLCDHNLVLGDIGSDCYIGEFIVDGDDRDHTSIPFRINSPSSNVVIGDMEWRNLHGVTALQTYGIYLPMYGAINFKIGDQRFINITQDDDGSVTGKGFVGGLYLVGFDVEVANGKSFGVVGDIYGQNIKSVDAGSGVVQDSDLVRSFAQTASTEKFDIVFGNITGRNVGKRLVKAGSCGGVTVGNVYSYVDDVVDGGVIMHATVECLATAFDWKFGRIGNEGPNTRVVWFQGCSGCTAGDIYNGWGSIAVVFGGTGSVATECSTGNVIGRRRDGEQKGTGCYFFDAERCQVGNLTGDFEWSVFTGTGNTGVNTVGDVNCSAKLDIQYGETFIGKFSLDVRTLTFNETPIKLGAKFNLTESRVTTDGARTVDIVGVIDGDIGNFKISRVSNSGGIATDIALVTTEGGVVSGKLKGSIAATVNNSIVGSSSSVPKQSLVYLDGLDLDSTDILLDITTQTRGSVGRNLWIENCNGCISNLLIRAPYPADSSVDGNITIDKAVNFADLSDLTLAANVNIFQAEKRADNTITGAVNTPVIVDSTRP